MSVSFLLLYVLFYTQLIPVLSQSLIASTTTSTMTPRDLLITQLTVRRYLIKYNTFPRSRPACISNASDIIIYTYEAPSKALWVFIYSIGGVCVSAAG